MVTGCDAAPWRGCVLWREGTQRGVGDDRSLFFDWGWAAAGGEDRALSGSLSNRLLLILRPVSPNVEYLNIRSESRAVHGLGNFGCSWYLNSMRVWQGSPMSVNSDLNVQESSPALITELKT